jgi:hypothetical protein
MEVRSVSKDPRYDENKLQKTVSHIADCLSGYNYPFNYTANYFLNPVSQTVAPNPIVAPQSPKRKVEDTVSLQAYLALLEENERLRQSKAPVDQPPPYNDAPPAYGK